MTERYLLYEIEPTTYLVLDTTNNMSYMVHAAPLDTLMYNYQVVLSQIRYEPKVPQYVIFEAEVLTFKVWTFSIEALLSTMTKFIKYHPNIGLDNPVELLPIYGGELHGKVQTWPSVNLGSH